MRGHFKDELRQKLIIKKNIPALKGDGDVSNIMCQLLKQQSASDIFAGNITDFLYFMAVFNEIVDRRN